MATTPLASVFSAAQMIRTGQEQLKQSLAELDKDALVDVVTHLVQDESNVSNLGRIGIVARNVPVPANTNQPSPPRVAPRKLDASVETSLNERHMVTKDGKPSLTWAIALVLKDASEPMSAKEVVRELIDRDWLPTKMENPGSSVWIILQSEKGVFAREGRGRYGKYKLIEGIEIPDTVDEAPKAPKQMRKAAEAPKIVPKARDASPLLTRVVKLLTKHPNGLRAEEIRANLGISAQEMPKPLKEGLKNSTLKKHGNKRATTYTLIGEGEVAAKSTKAETPAKPAKAEKAVEASEDESTTDPNFRGKVIRVLQKTSEPITVRDIVKAAKLTNYKQVNFLLMNMAKKHHAVKKLDKRSEGGQVLWEIDPEGLKSFIQSQN